MLGADLQHEFSFLSTTENLVTFQSCFLESDLGKIYRGIPFDNLVSIFKIKEKAKAQRITLVQEGRKLSLMFLKHYSCCSDKRWIEQLNPNIDYQIFCDIHLGFNRLTNYINIK